MKPTRNGLLGGAVYPLAVLIFGMLVLAKVDSSAKAAELAALRAFFVLLVAINITPIGNSMLLKSSSGA